MGNSLASANEDKTNNNDRLSDYNNNSKNADVADLPMNSTLVLLISWQLKQDKSLDNG